MALNMRQRDFMEEVRNNCTEFSRVVHNIQRLAEKYQDEFVAGQANAIVAADITDYGVTPAKLARLVEVSAQLQNFWNGLSVTAQDNKKFVQNLMDGL